jgi:tetratricopeptide (TPR) repeat protein
VDLTELGGHLLAGRSSRQPLTSYVRVSLTVDSTLANIVESPKKMVDTGYIDAYLRYGDRVSAEYSFKYVPNRSYFAVLVGPQNTPFVHYDIELDPENFSLEVDEDNTRLYTTLDVNLEVRDSHGSMVATNENAVFVELAPSELERLQAHPFAYQDDFPVVVPGKYNVSVTMRNRLTKQFTVVEQEINIDPLVGGPDLGDILLGYKTELVPGATHDAFRAFQIGAIRIHPSSGNVFSLGERVHVFFQVRDASPEQRLRFAILNKEETLQERETKIGDYRGGLVTEEFPLLDMVGGNYRLQVQLLDAGSAVVAERSSPLTVSPRASIPRPQLVSWYSFNTQTPGVLSLMRGEQLFFFGRLEEARTELEEAVAANPQLPMAKWELATVLLHMREVDQALELLVPLKEQYPDEYEVVEGLGLAYYFKDDYPQAVTYLEKAMTIRPPDISVLNALGFSYQQVGRVEDAKKVFERSLELKPEQAAIKEWLASLGDGGSR